MVDSKGGRWAVLVALEEGEVREAGVWVEVGVLGEVRALAQCRWIEREDERSRYWWAV